MSYSSLITMDKDYLAYEVDEFDNSWLFAPMLWTVLTRKYCFGERILNTMSGSHMNRLNNIMNNTKCTCDQICWELSLQQIFSTKDKHIVANAIRECIKVNVSIKNEYADDTGILQTPHIVERWEEIAKSIEELDEEEYPYFIFKNNSIDDGVWQWFGTEGTQSLKEYKNCGFPEFVIIKDGKVTGWIDHLDFDYNN